MTDRWTQIQIATLLILLFAVFGGVGLYTDFLWFQTTGYENVFLTIVKYKVALFALSAVAFFTFALINSYAASRSYAISRTDKGETEVITPERLNRMVVGIIAGLSVLFGFMISSSWELLLRYLNRQPFGVFDPVFGKDVGYYIFELPFFEALLRAAFTLLIFTTAITLFVYLLKSKSILFDMAISDIRFETPKFTSWAKAHLSLLLAAFFVLWSLNYGIQRYELLLSSRSATFFGAGYTDINITLPALKFMGYISLLIGSALVINIKMKRSWIPVTMAVVLLLTHLIVLGLYAGLVQEYRVKPNEIKLETPYIKNNIEFTTAAFGLETVATYMFQVNSTLTAADISRNAPTIKNIRLWDNRPLKDTYRQIQEIRLYYEFHDVDVDRYELNGNYAQVMLSAREIVPSQLPESAQNWINTHLIYTHGYGIVASPVDRVTKEGLPELLIKDIPPESTLFTLVRPEIYFGEMTDDYVLIKTAQEEFDYPEGDENIFTTYEETAGVPLDSYFKKLTMALRFGTTRLMLSKDVTSESRILLNRNIKAITEELTPYLVYDRDPYIVSSNGRLYWIMDGYTTASRYPYSAPYSGVNYIRNPVKAVIDAYSGRADFYVVDPTDPIIKAYSSAFPDVYKSFDEMPADLKKHIRYPEDMFTLQAEVYAKYHMKDPRTFYNLEDMWNVPNELYENKRILMEPYYVIMKLPGEETEEFIIMLPFTPRNKDNMIAWMYARSDLSNYGKLGVFKFPKQELVFGPMQVEARIDQDPTVSEQLTLWGQVGSGVIRGNLLVIPIENSILYVEPLYLLADQSRLPELKRVIVAYGEQIVMEETLQSAFSKLFGSEDVPRKAPADDISGEDLESIAWAHYLRAIDELKTGNWTGFGIELEKLGSVLESLREQRTD